MSALQGLLNWSEWTAFIAGILLSAIPVAAVLAAHRRSRSRLRALHAELAATHRRNQAIVEGSGEGVLELDSVGLVRYANPAAARLLGYEHEELIGLDYRVLINTRVKNLDLVPSNIDLSAAEIQLVNEVGREQSLARALYPVLDRYDYVLIDCQPSLGLLTVNGLACSDVVIIPTECEFFSLRGLALLTDTVDKVHDRLNPKLSIGGILITRCN